MALTYEKEITGLVVIDPYNDFISEGGKVWDRLKGVAEANQCLGEEVAFVGQTQVTMEVNPELPSDDTVAYPDTNYTFLSGPPQSVSPAQ